MDHSAESGDSFASLTVPGSWGVAEPVHWLSQLHQGFVSVLIGDPQHLLGVCWEFDPQGSVARVLLSL